MCSRPAPWRCTATPPSCTTMRMSGELILAAEGWTFAELAAAGWSEADIDWESASKRALQYLAAGDLDRAREEIAKSLRVANAEFPADDPRLGASLANQGAALVAAGKPELSRRSLGDAVRVWRSCDAWVAK